MRKIPLAFGLFLFFAVFSNLSVCFAQDTQTSEEDKLIEEETVRELKPTTVITKEELKRKKTWIVKTGGWITSLFRHYTDLDNDSQATDTTLWALYNDIRYWLRANYKNQYEFYLRFKYAYHRRNISVLSTSEKTDHEGPGLDMAYFRVIRNEWALPLDLTIGRQYLFIGRGIAYSDVGYGIKYKTNFGDSLFFKALASLSGENSFNYDQSIPNYRKHNDRIFAGAELATNAVKNQVVYAFILGEWDKTISVPSETPEQSYRYDARFYGLGFQSNLPKSRLSYWGELIKQDGESFTDTTVVDLEQRDIDAWSATAGLNYRFDLPLYPGVELEYAFGSGDRDRSSVTDTRSGGNLYGDDTNFNYFGSFFSGYALSPRLSNLHIYKIDLSILPLTKFKLTEQFALGAKYFLYRKDKKTGGIYDTDATLNSLDIGQEADAYLYWQINKNLLWSNRFGVFFPGDAYPDSTNNSTKYFYTRLTFTF